MFALRLHHPFTAGAIAFVVVVLPTSLAAQTCTAHSCTAVNHVQVTVPARLALPAVASQPVQANVVWQLDVEAGTTSAEPGMTATPLDWSRMTELHDTPGPHVAAVRYTLVGR